MNTPKILRQSVSYSISLIIILLGLSVPPVFAQTFPAYEVEPNNFSVQATPILTNPAKIRGFIYPNADEDFYSFQANIGDRVYIATMTSLSASASTDSDLALIAPDGVTIIESDDTNGTFGALSSSIAGSVIPVAGTYYIRVKHTSATGQLRPYDLYVQVQSGSPVAETEPNEPTPGQPLPVSGWVSGSTSSTTDIDIYSIDLNAGESVFLSLDLDPERDDIEWNGQIGMGTFGGEVLFVNDAGDTGPDSEAFFMTVKEAGTYQVVVGLPPGGTTFGTYHLSVSKFAAETGYTNYTSTDVPKVIPTGPGVITSTLNIPDSKRIKDLSVRLNLTHDFMLDLDVTLTSPEGNITHLFSDIGSGTSGVNTTMNLFFNDFNATPPFFQVTDGLGLTPELNALLNYFKGMDSQGDWTLTIYDDAAGDGGILNSWSIDILEDTDPDLTGFTTLFDEDFETDDGGFTHSGVQDEWERGTPSFAPITSANSGTQCWKTDLDNSYNASSNQVLESPDIDLTTVGGDIFISWAMKYHLESATFDQFTITLEEVGGGGMTQTLFTWYGATMNTTVGNPGVTVPLSAGWATFYADVSAFTGKIVRFRARLITDTTVQLSGVAIDDVKVYYKSTSSTILASAGAGGTISPSGNVNVANGEDQMFTITPDACYIIADVLVDGQSVGPVNSYTFFNVTTNHTISVSFESVPFGVWQNADVGNANGNADYPPCDTQLSDTITVQASGFSTLINDNLHLVSQELCGNVELIAHVLGVSNGGWAGITLRETLMPGSKKVALKTQLSNHLRREIRTTTNGVGNILNSFRPGHTWLRLVRSGNSFTGFSSTDGYTWTFAFSANISMSGCIHVGLFAESINNSVTTTATFDNVQIIGNILPQIQASHTNADVFVLSPEVYPNPTSGEVFIDLKEYIGKNIQIELYSLEGKLMQIIQLDKILQNTHTMYLDGYPNGMYFVKLKPEGLLDVTKKIVLLKG